MGISAPKIHKTDHHKMEIHGHGLVSMNEVLSECIQRAHKCYTLPDLIIRYENLPRVWGKKENISKLLDDLLGMIFQSSPNGDKLFLHIICEEEILSEVANAESSSNNFVIKFNTNLTTNETWNQIHARALARVVEIISLNYGLFMVNAIKHTGCLFSITLRGTYE